MERLVAFGGVHDEDLLGRIDDDGSILISPETRRDR